jgi:hypothetical protein
MPRSAPGTGDSDLVLFVLSRCRRSVLCAVAYETARSVLRVITQPGSGWPRTVAAFSGLARSAVHEQAGDLLGSSEPCRSGTACPISEAEAEAQEPLPLRTQRVREAAKARGRGGRRCLQRAGVRGGRLLAQLVIVSSLEAGIGRPARAG